MSIAFYFGCVDRRNHHVNLELYKVNQLPASHGNWYWSDVVPKIDGNTSYILKFNTTRIFKKA